MTNKSTNKHNSQVQILDVRIEYNNKNGSGSHGTTTTAPSGSGFGAVSNNGFRPHGGYRGTKKYPVGQYSFDKECRELDVDMDRMYPSLEYSSLESLTSPGYAIQTSRGITNSGNSPLFESRLLAPSRLEQTFSAEEYAEKLIRSQAKKPKRSGVEYYRPDSPHHYLTASSSSTSFTAHSQHKLGRPTRTTLLRERHRCNSAPVDNFKKRQEMIRQYEQSHENHRSKATVTVRDILGPALTEGESMHSFLIGARYNSAHCLDSRSILTHGVYMPRGNPLGCFVLRDRNQEDLQEVPPPPPDTPVSNFDDLELNNDGRPCTPVNKQAWSEENTENNEPEKTRSLPIMNLNEGFRLKKTTSHNNLNRKKPIRPRSAHVFSSGTKRRNDINNNRRSLTSRGHNKPFVIVQGKSMTSNVRAKGSLISPVMKSVFSNDDNRYSARPKSSKQHRMPESGVDLSIPTVQVQNPTAGDKLPQSQLKELSSLDENGDCDEYGKVKVAEVNAKNDSSKVTATHETKEVFKVNNIRSTENQATTEVKLETEEITARESEVGESGNDLSVRSKRMSNRVRFSDEVEEVYSEKDSLRDNVVFFMTEKKQGHQCDVRHDVTKESLLSESNSDVEKTTITQEVDKIPKIKSHPTIDENTSAQKKQVMDENEGLNTSERKGKAEKKSVNFDPNVEEVIYEEFEADAEETGESGEEKSDEVFTEESLHVSSEVIQQDKADLDTENAAL